MVQHKGRGPTDTFWLNGLSIEKYSLMLVKIDRNDATAS